MAKKTTSGTRRDTPAVKARRRATVAAAKARRVPRRPNNPIDLYCFIQFQIAALEAERVELKDKLVADLGPGVFEGNKFDINVQCYDNYSKDGVFKAKVNDLIQKHTRPAWRARHMNKTPCSRIYIRAKQGENWHEYDS